MKNYVYKISAILLAAVFFLSACGQTTPLVETPAAPTQAGSTAAPLATETATASPTPTPLPAAAVVNGESILLAEYEAELERFLAAGVAAPEGMSAEQVVLDDLIAQVLLAQAAREQGFSLSGETLEMRYQALIEQVGGMQAFTSWLAANSYSEESFRSALERSIYAAWMRDEVVSAVPESTEQVHARQIFLFDQDQAQEVLAQLETGKDFATLAAAFDPVAKGDLSWFPRGYLAQTALEEAAFALEAEAYSGIIETELGFHILQVIEREQERQLEPDALLVLQEKTLQEWVAARKASSQITQTAPEIPPTASP